MIAGLASFIFPGLGHVMCGRPLQGLFWFVVVIVGYLMLIVPGIILHVACIMDATREANRIEDSRTEAALRRLNQRR